MASRWVSACYGYGQGELDARATLMVRLMKVRLVNMRLHVCAGLDDKESLLGMYSRRT